MIRDYKHLIELQYIYMEQMEQVCESEMLSKYKLSILMITQMKSKKQNKLNWQYVPNHPYRN